MLMCYYSTVTTLSNVADNSYFPQNETKLASEKVYIQFYISECECVIQFVIVIQYSVSSPHLELEPSLNRSQKTYNN